MKEQTAGLIGMQEAAEYLSKTPAALRGGYLRWGITYMKFGGQVKFTKEGLDNWIKANTVTPRKSK